MLGLKLVTRLPGGYCWSILLFWYVSLLLHHPRSFKDLVDEIHLIVRVHIWRRASIKEVFQHDDVIKWKHFPRYWPFVRGIHRSPVNSLHKGQWRGALVFSLICARINGWVNNREVGDLRRHPAHYDVTVMGVPDLQMSCDDLTRTLTGEMCHWIRRQTYKAERVNVTSMGYVSTEYPN